MYIIDTPHLSTFRKGDVFQIDEDVAPHIGESRAKAIYDIFVQEIAWLNEQAPPTESDSYVQVGVNIHKVNGWKWDRYKQNHINTGSGGSYFSGFNRIMIANMYKDYDGNWVEQPLDKIRLIIQHELGHMHWYEHHFQFGADYFEREVWAHRYVYLRNWNNLEQLAYYHQNVSNAWWGGNQRDLGLSGLGEYECRQADEHFSITYGVYGYSYNLEKTQKLYELYCLKYGDCMTREYSLSHKRLDSMIEDIWGRFTQLDDVTLQDIEDEITNVEVARSIESKYGTAS